MTRRRGERHESTTSAFTGNAAVLVRRTVTAVVFIIAGLTFCFGFGNGNAVGLMLGAPGWMAPLVAPAVDLTVVALLASMQYLRASGDEGRLIGPRLLLLFSGTATLAMNTAHPILIGALHGTVPGPSPVVPDDGPTAVPELVARARQLDAAHREQHGRPITRDKLRAGLRVSNAVAGDVLRQVRAQ